MKRFRIGKRGKSGFWAFGALLFGLTVSARAERGDLFLELAPRASFGGDSLGPGIGGALGLSFGANERTDLGLLLHFDQHPGEDGGEDAQEIGAVLTSFFTPYLGDFRPRFGAHLGFSLFDEEPALSAGVDLQALYQPNDRVQFHAGIVPDFLFGKESQFFLRVPVGVRIRLGR